MLSKKISIALKTFFPALVGLISMDVIKGKHQAIKEEATKIGKLILKIYFVSGFLVFVFGSFFNYDINIMKGCICIFLLFIFCFNMYIFLKIWHSIFKKRLQDESEE
jgi:hypothetical protein